MDIRKATENDIPELTELLDILFSQEEEFEPDPALQKKGLDMIICNPETGTILIGRINHLAVAMINILYTVSTAKGQKVAILEDLIVRPGYRGKGIGSQLMEYAISEAQRNDCGRITLLTDSSNVSARRFYERHGFKPSAMIPYRLQLSESS